MPRILRARWSAAASSGEREAMAMAADRQTDGQRERRDVTTVDEEEDESGMR
jgi:hypothetical protein